MFLAKQDEYTGELKKVLLEIPGYEVIIADVMNMCVHHLETPDLMAQWYVSS